MDFSDNIDLVQPAPTGKSSEAPLVLFHDGGGTIVSYYFLESLDRAVYAIQNPHFYSGEKWEDGLPEMGRIYAELIRSELGSGNILLGGWSLGGLLSLEVASIFARSSEFRVLGIVMIDSIFPDAIREMPPNVVQTEPIFSANTGSEMRQRVSLCMRNAYEMSTRWIPPVWKGCEDTEQCRKRARLENDLNERLDAKYTLNTATISPDAGTGDLPPIPDTVLLRASEHVPVSKPDVPDAISRVDMTRKEPKLGWDVYGYDFISAAIDVPGHHFNMFTEENCDEVSSKIKLACRMHERVSV